MIGSLKSNNRNDDGNFVGETSKAHNRRKKEGWFEKFAPEHLPGIDIGCGIDPLNDSFMLWDQMYGCGDATYMEGVPDNSFFTVFCMEKNSPILTKNGFKFIQNLLPNDEVWTHKKRWKKVIGNCCFRRDDKIKIKTAGNPVGINVTADHPILINIDGPNKYGMFNKKVFAEATERTEFVTANCLSLSYLSVCPLVDCCENKTEFDLAEILTENEKIKLYKEVFELRKNSKIGDKSIAKITNQTTTLIRGWIYHNKKPYGYHKLENEILFHSAKNDFTIKRFLPITENLMRLLGYFLADGSLSFSKKNYHVAFHFNTNEKQYIDDVKNIIFEFFGIKETDIRQCKDSEGLNIRYCSKILYDVFFNIFSSRKCHFKSIPAWALWVKPNLQMQLIEGYFRGDGTISKDNKTISLNTVSPLLAEGLRLCLLRNGIFAGLYKIIYENKKDAKIKGCGYSYCVKYTIERKTMRGGCIESNHIISRIISIEKETNNLPMYGIQVEDDESYYASGIMHHNCSHVLEHVDNPVEAVSNWWRILQPGGNLIINVPHRDLYERKKELPSRYNKDHRSFWLPMESEPPNTFSLAGVIAEATKQENFLLRVLQDDYCDPGIEMHAGGEYSIEAIVQKPLFVF